MLKAVVFDIDGTLVDSNELHVAAWVEAFKKFGKSIDPDPLREQMGKGGDQLIPVFCTPDEIERFGEDLKEFRGELFKRDYLSRVKPFPNVRKLFERIKQDGMSIALASSASDGELEQHKKNLQIEDLLETSTSADDAEKSKPQPDIFVAALSSLPDVEPEDAIVVGDTPYDVEAAGKAGMRTIGVLSGGFSEEALRNAGAVAIYRDISELLEGYDQSLLSKHSARAAQA